MAIQMPDEKWIQSTMKTLDLTREEALEMWCDDHDIDMGKAKEFDGIIKMGRTQLQDTLCGAFCDDRCWQNQDLQKEDLLIYLPHPLSLHF